MMELKITKIYYEYKEMKMTGTSEVKIKKDNDCELELKKKIGLPL